MSLRDDLQNAIARAMKAGDSATVSTLRLLWSGIRTEEINTRTTLDDDGFRKIVSRQVKQLKDALHDFELGGRTDLVEQARVEIATLSAYLPKEMDDEELSLIIRQMIEESDIKDKSATGRIVGAVMKRVSGRADGSRVKAAVEHLLK